MFLLALYHVCPASTATSNLMRHIKSRHPSYLHRIKRPSLSAVSSNSSSSDAAPAAAPAISTESDSDMKQAGPVTPKKRPIFDGAVPPASHSTSEPPAKVYDDHMWT